jgi:hypothetical protein
MTNGAKLRVSIVGLGRAGRIHPDAWRPLTGARVVVERDSCTATLPVPLLDPGKRLTLRELDRALPGAELRVQVAS